MEKEQMHWEGTKAEMVDLIDYILEQEITENPILQKLSKKTIRKIFCEAMRRNVVLEELREMMEYIYNPDEFYAKKEGR